MKDHKFNARLLAATVCLLTSLLLSGCSGAKPNPEAEAPPAASVQSDFDPNNFKVEHPELFPLATAPSARLCPR